MVPVHACMNEWSVLYICDYTDQFFINLLSVKLQNQFFILLHYLKKITKITFFSLLILTLEEHLLRYQIVVLYTVFNYTGYQDKSNCVLPCDEWLVHRSWGTQVCFKCFSHLLKYFDINNWMCSALWYPCLTDVWV